jgi:hypothetical protein
MFQIGRSSESAIDFIVLDTSVTPQTGSISSSSQQQQSNTIPSQSTISRFACRITVDRDPPYTARIYAAGFDSSKRIFLGVSFKVYSVDEVLILYYAYIFKKIKDKATKWKNEKGELDGVTTNGVLIMHPTNDFTGNESKTSEWLEVSVCGAVFSLKDNRLSPNLKQSSSSKEPHDSLRSNILRDGTLIDLCGATLLWRSAESLKSTPNKHYLDINLNHLNRIKPQCPVGLKTLIFPLTASPLTNQQKQQLHLRFVEQQPSQKACPQSSNLRSLNNESCPIAYQPVTSTSLSSSSSSNKEIASKQNLSDLLKKKFINEIYVASSDRTPMVYLKCGHVHGHHDWGIKKDNERECPLCRKVIK